MDDADVNVYGMTAQVVRVSIAPVKALRLVHPDEVMLAEGGIRGDRRFWLLGDNGKLYNSKRDGNLLRVRSEWDEATRRLTLFFPGGERVDGVVELGEEVDALMYGEPRPSRTVIGPWQDALREYTGKQLTLLWAVNGAVDRALDNGTISVISLASLDRLRVEAGLEAPIDGRRFRMTFEVDGIGAHEEDEWIGKRVQIGEAEVTFSGDIGRCIVTSRDPDTGVSDLPTLVTLAAYRRDGYTEPLPCGIRGRVSSPGRVRVGDIASVLSDAIEPELRHVEAHS